MNIENNIFKKSSVIIDKLDSYGFIKNDNIYKYEKTFLNNSFKAIVTINKNGLIKGSVIDLSINEEYYPLRTEMSGEFVNSVREEYKSILNDIKRNCFYEKSFISNQANRIAKYIKEKYNNNPEFLWKDDDETGVFRNSNSKKWYGIIMNIDISKIDEGTGKVEIMNIKLDENKIDSLVKEIGFYRAYHMNKEKWISIILNDTLDDKVITDLIDESYSLVR